MDVEATLIIDEDAGPALTRNEFAILTFKCGYGFHSVSFVDHRQTAKRCSHAPEQAGTRRTCTSGEILAIFRRERTLGAEVHTSKR